MKSNIDHDISGADEITLPEQIRHELERSKLPPTRSCVEPSALVQIRDERERGKLPPIRAHVESPSRVQVEPSALVPPSRVRVEASAREALGRESPHILHRELSYAIGGAVIEVHRHLGPGQVEANYERALAHELTLRGIAFERQVAIESFYKGERVGEFFADIIVEDKIILELKSVLHVHPVHRAQLELSARHRDSARAADQLQRDRRLERDPSPRLLTARPAS